MAVSVGFNQAKAKDVMQDIKRSFNDLESTISEEWNSVRQALIGNWVGDDEQSFEKSFCEKVNKLYESASTLQYNAQNAIYEAASAWHKFQRSNNLGDSVEASTFTLSAPNQRNTGNVLNFHKRSIGQSEDRGLVSEGSASTIKSAVEDYVQSIKAKTKGLYDAIEVNSAFFGEQTAGIKQFIEVVGQSISEVISSVKDLYDALDSLAKSNYSQASSTVSSEFTSAATEVTESVSAIGGRWG